MLLTNLRVAEVGERLSTAVTGRILADAGATVVKVEPSGGDPIRAARPDHAAFLHGGKWSVTAGDDLAEALAPVATELDIAVCETPEQAEDLRSLRTDNPGLVIVCVTDYGATGPEADTPATDLTLQVEAGIAAMHLSPTSEPSVMGIPLSEWSAGVTAAVAGLQGMMASDAGADVVDVDVSRFESLLSLLTFPWNWDEIEGHVRYNQPLGGRPFIPPMNTQPQIIRAKDGWACLAANTPPQWAAVQEMMGIAELRDQKYDQVSTRANYTDELVGLMERFTTRYSVEELIATCAEHRVPIAPVATPETSPALPPFASRNTVVPSADGRFRQPRPPIRHDSEQGPWSPPPLAAVGAHDGAPLPPRRWRRGAVTPEAEPGAPLRGMRVVAFDVFHAGALATTYLAGLGAEVIKVEAVMRPDMIRYAGVGPEFDRSWERGGTYISLNLAKRGITADLGSPEGIGIIKRLLTTAEVVFDNYAPRTLDERGLDHDSLLAIRPDLLHVRMPGWGLDGLWRGRPAYTQLAEATSGLASLTGFPDDPPRLTGTVVDPVATLFGVFGLLAGILHRQQTGRGGLTEVALCDVGAALTSLQLVDASAGRGVPRRLGNGSADHAPQGIYATADADWIGLAVTSDDEWARLAARPEVPDWAGRPDYATAEGRLAHRDRLDERVAQWAATLPAAALVALLRAEGIAASKLAIGAELIDHPQVVSRGRRFTARHPLVGELTHLGPASRLSVQQELPSRKSAPLLGEDNHALLEELGYGEDEIADLAARGEIGNTPFAKPVAPTP